MIVSSEACSGEPVIIVPSGACNGKAALLNLQRGEFGSDYDKEESCQWRIEVDDDQHVRLDFNSFTLQACSNCSCDKMNIYDGRDATAPLIQTLCGSDLPGTVESSGKQLFVHFESDGASVTRGFRIKYSAVGKACYYCMETNSKGAVHS
ncbi:hypothetical protein NP493_60g05060 [Ridgeia piscesae]|uniref:CUB domain-containing protein n=1 Tax=Ridgeia piscesae TaxID=27915 RepID=A0AAD9UJ01_RIDPI|nr:hypothetical protein NP493_60g05060 [Ridgeia piscesae]